MKKTIWDKLHVRVDQVKPGFGTSNTGNVARKCFDQPELFAEALGLDPQFVKNISIILKLFRSEQLLDLDKVEEFCRDVYWQHYDLYDWTKMSPKVHKFLRHSCEILREFPEIPPAYLAEDAGEFMHGFYKNTLVNKSRQMSREARMVDTARRACYFTDPTITMIE